ncbi:MAG: Neu5Ac permease, partial [Pseudomonadota bacterium]
QQMVNQTLSFPMLALPFFILSGSLMMSGKLGETLIGFATELVQRFRGGLGSVSVLGSCVFGGVSGSAVADATALGGMLIPWQKRSGYPAGFCAANNASSATIAILIPPSIPFILYSLVSNVSVAFCRRATWPDADDWICDGELHLRPCSSLSSHRINL